MMKKILLPIVITAIITTISLSACSSNDGKTSNGYVEADLIYIASPIAGELTQLDLQKGDAVKTHQRLYQLDSAPQRFDVAETQAERAAASADLANLLYGKRQTELDQIHAQIKQAQAQLDYANKQLKRYQQLIKTGAIQQETLDAGIQEAKTAEGKLTDAQAKLADAKLPARNEQIESAKANQQKTDAALNKAKWQLSEKTVYSPTNGHIFDTYYHPGEQVPANRPVLSILAPQEIKIIFFVSAKQLPDIHLKQTVTVTTSDHKASTKAHIAYISNETEYTPPVLYTQKQSAKLVFRIQAVFDNNDETTVFHPGQPVEIHYDKS